MAKVRRDIWFLDDGNQALADDGQPVECLDARRVDWDQAGDEQPEIILLRHSAWDRFCSRLRDCKHRWRSVPVMGLIPEVDVSEEPLRAAFEEGLDDFVLTPLRLLELVARLQHLAPQSRSAETRRREGAVEAWKRQHRLEGLIGECPEFVQALEKIPVFSITEATVLILGETGTGKELFAHAIHYCSLRKAGPFVPVNCGAVPEHLFENELFGHVKGAFTDASSRAGGLISLAEGGTLFLDEVDSLPAAAQVKLLRLLQNREYRPLGSPHTMSANVRVVAASNTDPRALVSSGRLREDLYHRLNVLRIHVPPLRRRHADIALLAGHFLEQFGRNHNRPCPRLTPGALETLAAYTWPGNIRELEAVMQRAILLSGPVIEAGVLELDSGQELEFPSDQGEREPLRESKARLIETFERTYLIQLLQQFGGNVSQAASAAGKERRTFQRLLRKRGIQGEHYKT